MSQSNEIDKLVQALLVVQKNAVYALKDAENPFFKSQYADLESVWAAIRKPLADNGLVVIQTSDQTDTGPSLITTLAHVSGQWIRGYYPLNPVKNDPQSMGSAVTYARRYALAAIIGVVQVDDDGALASGTTGQDQPKKPLNSKPVSAVKPAPLEPSTNAYIVKFGKFRDQPLDQIDQGGLRSYIQYLEKKAVADGKPLSGVAQEFVDQASLYLVREEQNNDIHF